jgi:hypothetical protein
VPLVPEFAVGAPAGDTPALGVVVSLAGALDGVPPGTGVAAVVLGVLAVLHAASAAAERRPARARVALELMGRR